MADAAGMSPRSRQIRRLAPIVTVLAIALGTVLPARAFAPEPTTPGALDRAGSGTAAQVPQPRIEAHPAPVVDSASVAARRPTAVAPVVVPASVELPAATPVVESTSAAASVGGGSSPTAYRGRNHVWIPSLGMSRSVSFFSCSRNTALGHVVYRWGCAGSNNVYLMGHASSVFKPLHDAYRSGRLHKGMQVVYADANGRVRTYKVTFWKVVKPDGDVAWAYAAQSRPSLTLQTCVGANSAYRLVVRLVAAG